MPARSQRVPVAPIKTKLGEILLEMGVIDPLQLKSALGKHQERGIPLGKAVVEGRFCSEEDVLRALSIQSGHPVIKLDGRELDSSLVSILPVRSAERLRAVPLRLEGKRKEVLVVALAAPGGLETLDAIQSVSGKQKLEVHLAQDDEVTRAIGKLYYGRVPDSPPAPVHAASHKEPPEVRIFGWHEASMRALQAMIERGGIKVSPLADEELFALKPADVLIASTLGLHANLPSGEKVPARLIICGVREDLDVDDARALGARMYLRPPFSMEQLKNAIERVSG
jgi:hypothetical protein